MKKFLFLFLCAALLTFGVLADDARSYDFELSVNGTQTENTEPGDILTFTLTLHRTDSDEAAPMYAMQDEISYDADFFRFVEGGSLMRDGVEITDIAVQGSERRLYISFISFTGGETWEADTLVGTFQMEIIGTEGSSTLLSQNALVSNQDGSGSYTSTVQDATAVITSDCTVRFDPLNGEGVTELKAEVGEHLTRPENPMREGCTFVGWSRDTYGLELWDFENDTVTGNMTLYGTWEEGTAPTEAEEPGEAAETVAQSSPLLLPLVILLAIVAVLLLVLILLQFKRRKQ